MQHGGSKDLACIPPQPNPHDPGGESKGHTSTFYNMVMLHIKLKGMEHRAPLKHIFSPYTNLNLWVRLKGKQKSECGHGKKICMWSFCTSN